MLVKEELGPDYIEYYTWYGVAVSRETFLDNMREEMAKRADKSAPMSCTWNYRGNIVMVPQKPPTFCERVAAVFKP